MNIKNIIEKVLKGETLTDEEKTELRDYNPQKDLDNAAAAVKARYEKRLNETKAEADSLKAKIQELETDAEEKAKGGKTELEQLQAKLSKIEKQAADRDAQVKALEDEKAQIMRSNKVAKIMAGVKFIDGLNPDIGKLALETSLKELKDDELDDELSLKPVLDKFREENKAILADTTGGGSGNPGKSPTSGGGSPSVTFTRSQIKAMSPEDYEKNRDNIWKAEQAGQIKED